MGHSSHSKFCDLLSGLEIYQLFALVENPQANGQANVTNKIILKGLKKRLDDSLSSWAYQLWSILWSYCITIQSITGETLFKLSYGEEAVISVKNEKPSPRLLLESTEHHENLDLVDEVKVAANLAEQELKQKVTKRYNTKVRPRSFRAGDLVLKQAGVGTSESQGMLAPTWK
ncbi:uncharacterized protein [Arachis hypogaea]|uniref:uncharacterized protein n=1 Tax=Arachis hypogaea TaxID=3818 RepID=UPI003B21DF57